jgi:hypothetical protein
LVFFFQKNKIFQLFNALNGLPVQYTSVIETLAKRLSGNSDRKLTARYPNPFKGVNGPSGFDRSDKNELAIVDGGKFLSQLSNTYLFF